MLDECYSMLEGADAVIHLAAVQSMYLKSNEVMFQTNVVTTYNVLESAVGCEIKKQLLH
jgi:nucleoside-diphosphate-sugar epimerase